MAVNMETLNNGETFGSIREKINGNFNTIKDNLDELPNFMSANDIIFGTYTGTGTDNPVNEHGYPSDAQVIELEINLGAQPVAVEVYRYDGAQYYLDSTTSRYYGGLAIRGNNFVENPNYPMITIENQGFKVYYYRNNREIRVNEKSIKYYYKAYMNGTVS